MRFRQIIGKASNKFINESMSVKRKIILSGTVFTLVLLAIGMYQMSKVTIEEYTSNGVTVYTIKTSASNVYIAKKGDNVVMIDTGDPTQLESIEKAIRELGVEIDLIIITHAHADHAGNGKYFRDKYGIKIIGGAGDQELFRSGTNGELCPTSAPAKLIQHLSTHVYEGYEPDIYVEDEFDLRTYRMNGKVIQIPGHTEGTLVVLIEDLLFVGDIIRGEMFSQSTPAIHLFHCDLELNKTNIRSLLLDYPDTRWHTGHFGIFNSSDVKEFIQ